ncbi:hypothetical protein [Micromonospora sp. CPCC 206061]|uniref:hypothetical protein n=1 Tax=Micromonospora sp. CPCC 206061 TaxID=3122410 RepID=UPI002FEED481
MTPPSGVQQSAQPVTRRRQAIRRAVAIPLAVVATPLVALYVYLLLWWLPALGGPGPNPCDPLIDGRGACWRPEQRTFWLVAATAVLLSGVCLVMAVMRTGQTRRWWPWPAAAAVLLAGCAQALDQIP